MHAVQAADDGKVVIVIGLDWHSVTYGTDGFGRRPCELVGAPKVGQRETFRSDMQDVLNFRKEDSAERHETWRPFAFPGEDVAKQTDKYYEYWKDMTLDKLMLEEQDKFDCENCPLMLALQGADSTDSFFLGATVSSCDFRGKRISADDALSEDVRESAYLERNLDEMLAYADTLEDEIEVQRELGNLLKVPYAQYKGEWKSETFHWAPLMTEEEWDASLHWREQSLREAIHWLRTCAGMGVSMVTSY